MKGDLIRIFRDLKFKITTENTKFCNSQKAFL